MFLQITKMLLKTVFDSATAQQFIQLSEHLKNISCCGCLLGKVFKILRVRQYRILFTTGLYVYNIRFIECNFVQITTKLLHMALNSLYWFLQSLDRWMQIITNHFANFGQDFQNTLCPAVPYFFFFTFEFEMTELPCAMFAQITKMLLNQFSPFLWSLYLVYSPKFSRLWQLECW